jgi:hypothetical protein
VERNRGDCDAIADHAGELMEAIIRAMDGKTEADLDERFKRDLDSFVGCASFSLKSIL